MFEYLSTMGKGFSEEVSRHYFHQLVDSLEYLHNSQEIVHRDLKIENLLLDKNYQLKLADFGLSIKKHGNLGTGIMYSRVGTRNYMAPEVLEKRPYRGTSVDIFALGVILFTMATGTMPFEQQASIDDSLYQYIIDRQYDDFWEAWSQSEEGKKCNKAFLTDDFKDLIVRLLTYECKDRPTLKQIQNHPWFLGKLPKPEQVRSEVFKMKCGGSYLPISDDDIETTITEDE